MKVIQLHFGRSVENYLTASDAPTGRAEPNRAAFPGLRPPRRTCPGLLSVLPNGRMCAAAGRRRRYSRTPPQRQGPVAGDPGLETGATILSLCLAGAI